MIARIDGSYEKNSIHLNKNWYKNEPDNFVIDETTEEGKVLANKIIENYPFYDLVIEDSQLVDITPWDSISYTAIPSLITTEGICVITTDVGVTAIIDETEYTLDDGILEYQNSNIGEHHITLKKDGFKTAYIKIEVISNGS